jgi:hypothetical protein
MFQSVVNLTSSAKVSDKLFLLPDFSEAIISVQALMASQGFPDVDIRHSSSGHKVVL